MLRVSIFAAGLLLAACCGTYGQTLHVGSPVSAQFEDGPPLGALQLVPGEVVYFSFTADGYKRSETGRVELTGHVQVFDSAGVAVAPVDEIPLITTLTEDDKNWIPKLRSAVSLPSIARPGIYKVKFDVTDEQSHQSASGEAAFSVQGKLVSPSPVVAVRELNFYRNQDETTAMITPSYRAGDVVWVKFYIVGYKYGEQNSLDVSYDVELLGPDGTSILKREEAAMEKSMGYYPQPWIQEIFNMSLKSTMTKTTYTLVITAHDAVGNQTASAQSKFQVN